IHSALPIHPCLNYVDLLKRESVRSAVLLFPARMQRAEKGVIETLQAVNIDARAARLPRGCRTVLEALKREGGVDALREGLEPPATPQEPEASPKPSEPEDQFRLTRGDVSFTVRPYPVLLGRLRAVIRAERESSLHVDTIDLYSSKARADFAKRAAKALN